MGFNIGYLYPGNGILYIVALHGSKQIYRKPPHQFSSDLKAFSKAVVKDCAQLTEPVDVVPPVRFLLILGIKLDHTPLDHGL